MKKSIILIVILISNVITYILNINSMDVLLSRISIIFFVGVYFIVKQLEENKIN